MRRPTADDLERLLWRRDGARRIPSAPAFDRLVSSLPPGVLWRTCELNRHGPVYLIPTLPFLRGVARLIRSFGARRVVEVAAGDGHFARSLKKVAPDLRITATDSGAWERPQARMSPVERRRYRGKQVAGLAPGDDVLRMDALDAIRRLRPDLVLACWIPPGPLLGRLVRAAPAVLEIGAGSGITGDIRCWRYPHEFREDLDALGRCRLDERPRRRLHTRVTLYFRTATRRP